jgi:hypothetical protein
MCRFGPAGRGRLAAKLPWGALGTFGDVRDKKRGLSPE